MFFFVGFELGGLELQALPLSGCLQFKESRLVLLNALVLLEFVLLHDLIPVSFALLLRLDFRQLYLLLQVLDTLLEFGDLQLVLIRELQLHQLQILLEDLAFHLLTNAVLLTKRLHVPVASLGFSQLSRQLGDGLVLFLKRPLQRVQLLTRLLLLHAQFRFECFDLLGEGLHLAAALIPGSAKCLTMLVDKRLLPALEGPGHALLFLLEKSFLGITIFQLKAEVLDLLLQESILLGQGVAVLPKLLCLFQGLRVLKVVHEVLGIILHVMDESGSVRQVGLRSARRFGEVWGPILSFAVEVH